MRQRPGPHCTLQNVAVTHRWQVHDHRGGALDPRGLFRSPAAQRGAQEEEGVIRRGPRQTHRHGKKYRRHRLGWRGYRRAIAWLCAESSCCGLYAFHVGAGDTATLGYRQGDSAVNLALQGQGGVPLVFRPRRDQSHQGDHRLRGPPAAACIMPCLSGRPATNYDPGGHAQCGIRHRPNDTICKAQPILSKQTAANSAVLGRSREAAGPVLR